MMDRIDSEKRIAGLKKASEEKKKTALNRTNQAIDNLVKNKQKITVRAVAKEAGVSVSYLYKYPEISYRIQSLRNAQRYSISEQKRVGNKNVDKAGDKVKTKKSAVEENTYLKSYIKSIEGKKNLVSDVQKENIKLQIENEKLKKELEFTRQKLAEIRDFILSQGYDDTQDKIKLEMRERVVKQIT